MKPDTHCSWCGQHPTKNVVYYRSEVFCSQDHQALWAESRTEGTRSPLEDMQRADGDEDGVTEREPVSRAGVTKSSNLRHS